MSSTDGPRADFFKAVAEIRTPWGAVAGAGFLVGPDLLVTCAHVVHQSGYGPGSSVPLAFPGLPERPEAEGVLLDEGWRAIDAEDVAFLRLEHTPPDVPILALGSAQGCRGRRASTYGFPEQAGPNGHFGHLRAGHLLNGADAAGGLLQLSEANDLTEGFSGAPVVDDMTGLVIGMVTAITPKDTHSRGQNIAYATPTHVLRTIQPALAEHSVCPYRGLEPFTAEHVAYFYGRSAAKDAVISALRQQRRALLLLGPSGSGKSSLIQAGVLPALADEAVPTSDRWLPVVVSRPGRDLLSALERHGLPGATADGITAASRQRLDSLPPHTRLLLVIDQFEELLTPRSPAFPHPSSGGSDVRRAFDQLTQLAQSPLPVTLVLIMRDDFYAPLAAQAPVLLQAVSPPLNIPTTLTEADLQSIIERPAARAGLHIETGLVNRIISELMTTAVQSVGLCDAAEQENNSAGRTAQAVPVTSLPALELTLQQLWNRRTDGRLTHRAYEQLGTVTGALTTWCAEVFDQLPNELHRIARGVLTALVLPADPHRGSPAARLRIPLTTLHELTGADDPASGSRARVDTVVNALTRYRIIVIHVQHRLPEPSRPGEADVPVAELIHDSLIRDWHDLHTWVVEDQDFSRWLDRAEAQHTLWKQHQRKADGLLRGSDLASGIEYGRRRGIPSHIRRFITVSRRRARLRTRILATLLCLALIATGLAVWQWHTATVGQQQALSRQLAAESETLTGTHPDLASLLAVYAYRTYPTAEANNRLTTAASTPLLHTLPCKANTECSVAFSPDGRTLATATDENLRLWDVTTGHLLHTLIGHTSDVYSVVFSPDGRTVATASDDHTARLWDASTGHLLHTLDRHTDAVLSAVFSPDSHILATASDDGTARLWDVTTGRLLHVLDGSASEVYSAVFSPNGHTLATTTAPLSTSPTAVPYGTARLWDVTTGHLLRTLPSHLDPSSPALFSPNNRTLATSSNDHAAQLWDVATGHLLHTFTHSGNRVYSEAFSPDGRILATSDDDDIELRDAATGRILHSLTGHTNSVEQAVFSPDGHTLATAGADHTARLWDVATGDVLRVFIGHSDIVSTVAFSSDGHTLATTGFDGTARLWDTVHYPRVLTGHTKGVYSVVFSPDGLTLATASFDHTARLWDVTTGHLLHTLTGHTKGVYSVVFSPDGRTLATASFDHTARLWDVTTGHLLHALTGHTNVLYQATFSPDGHTLVATASNGGTARLWNVATGRLKATLDVTPGAEMLPGLSSAVFSPNGLTLAAAVSDDQTAHLWDVTTGRLLTNYVGHTDNVYSVVFSPDGRTLATASFDHTARLWDVTTGHLLHTLTGHTDWVNIAVFSPDGHTLGTASGDGTARLWNIATGHLLHTL
ncbi:nSTAND1 domain-containing NTPase, partial [Streptomyces griseorubiginosus]|uniref:nSTAND1 domain-containing NTPase n=1 Tax=Streptomyces griseorubiginosus TaxID=67304 RepID=UPI003452D2D6